MTVARNQTRKNADQIARDGLVRVVDILVSEGFELLRDTAEEALLTSPGGTCVSVRSTKHHERRWCRGGMWPPEPAPEVHSGYTLRGWPEAMAREIVEDLVND